MKISATAALVMNWTDPELWQCKEAQNYQAQLDLSEGDRLYHQFSAWENYMHLHCVSDRKFYMKEQVFAFLNRQENQKGQVLMLAAGLTPLSLEIGATFPNAKVFDIDRYLMEGKKSLVNNSPPNIAFIECDITDVHTLDVHLHQHGLNPATPTIAVLEGIVYYLEAEKFRTLLRYLKSIHAALAGDFGLKPEVIHPETQSVLTELFQKITQEVQLNPITYYTPEEALELISAAGYDQITLDNLKAVQEHRTGSVLPFDTEDKGWLMAFRAE